MGVIHWWRLVGWWKKRRKAGGSGRSYSGWQPVINHRVVSCIFTAPVVGEIYQPCALYSPNNINMLGAIDGVRLRHEHETQVVWLLMILVVALT